MSHPTTVQVAVDDAVIVIGLLEFLIKERPEKEDLVGIANRVSARLRENIREAGKAASE